MDRRPHLPLHAAALGTRCYPPRDGAPAPAAQDGDYEPGADG
ncbi:MAG: hypothetical protein WDM81_13820 [Rhizomicrobium sp.]